MNVNDITDLTDDGDVLDVGDRWQLRLSVVPDEDASINDYDCDGKTSEYAYRYTDREARERRPDGFTGAARKIEVDRGLWVWWQPADDMTSAKRWGGPPDQYSQVFRDYVSHVTDILREGFVGMVLDLYERVSDSHGGEHWVEVQSASLWGIESYADTEYKRTIVSDLLNELDLPVELVPTKAVTA